MMNRFTIDMIDTSTREGRILLQAIAHIATTTHTDATPDEILHELERRIYPETRTHTGKFNQNGTEPFMPPER